VGAASERLARKACAGTRPTKQNKSIVLACARLRKVNSTRAFAQQDMTPKGFTYPGLR